MGPNTHLGKSGVATGTKSPVAFQVLPQMAPGCSHAREVGGEGRPQGGGTQASRVGEFLLCSESSFL